MRTIAYRDALKEALAEEMSRDPKVVIWGLDVGPYGGAFGVTQGLSEEFGCERVIDMPISEAGYVGSAVGAAVTGLRPVVELQFSDWITIATDQLINHAAKIRYMFGGVLKVPLVLRAPVGGYVSSSADHCQMFESIFTFIPGLKVVLPSTPYDAKGLLKAAIREDNPVIFFEHNQLYKTEGEVPEEEYLIPLGKADVKREGNDATIVTYSFMVLKSLAAAATLAKEGISVEVVDLRTTDPMDEEAILESLAKTNHLVIVQETWPHCSVSSEVAAMVAQKGLDSLDAPVLRVTCENVPVPFSPALENFVLPQEADIVEAVKKVLA
jgi:pyruvate/2-oxoglutarate/acetoin dehydrogenase E1 component